MKLTSILILILLMFSCSLKRQIAGKYQSKSNSNVFEFKSDSTFLNEYSAVHLAKYAVGTWQKANDSVLILNTAIKSTVVPSTLTFLDSSKVNYVTLKIGIKIGSGLDLTNYYCNILPNRLDTYTIRCDSLSTIRLFNPLDSISFSFIKVDKSKYQQNTFGLETKVYKFNTPPKRNMDIQIAFSDSLFYYHAFDNEKIKLRKNGIEIYNPYQRKWDFLKKVPSSTKIFFHFDD